MNLKLQNVRLSFPALFKPRAMEEGQEPKYSATFIMDKVKNKKEIAEIRATIDSMLKEHFRGKVPKVLKPRLRDGAEKASMDGYGDGVMFISANNAKRFPIVDRDLTPLTEQDPKPYAGCYVNASIRLWVQDNKWGKGVNAELRAVQFVKDGESFGGATVADANEEFTAIDGDDDTDVML